MRFDQFRQSSISFTEKGFKGTCLNVPVPVNSAVDDVIYREGNVSVPCEAIENLSCVVVGTVGGRKTQ